MTEERKHFLWLTPTRTLNCTLEDSQTRGLVVIVLVVGTLFMELWSTEFYRLEAKPVEKTHEGLGFLATLLQDYGGQTEF
mmetsp:Transcript_9822/g.22688  ORF Transcript_9822/g.22688 Transcript_9822/m.22688 type:complete len:80 (+) Transcript_9822:932-1171(+)